MYRFYSILLLLIGFSTLVYATDPPITPHGEEALTVDTIEIDQVDIVSKVSGKYQVGTKTQTFTPLQKQGIPQGSLNDLISRYSPVYIKSDAGGLSGIRFRGTSTNHTSVFIGGLDINSLTLGSSNMSSVPIYLFDDINMMFGSASATNGSGSIGGSVRLGFNNKYKKGVSSEINTLVGSFGEYMGGAKIFISDGKWEFVTRLLYYEKENNFPFLNIHDKNIETGEFPIEEQQFAAIKNKNFIQQINYKYSNNKDLTSFIWLGNNSHQIQPTMPTNATKDSAHIIEDENIRTWIKFTNNQNRINYFIAGGYVNDNNIDHNNTKQSIGTQRFIIETEIKQDFEKIKYKLNTKYKYIAPDVYAYDSNIIEQHLDLSGSLFYNPITTLETH